MLRQVAAAVVAMAISLGVGAQEPDSKVICKGSKGACDYGVSKVWRTKPPESKVIAGPGNKESKAATPSVPDPCEYRAIEPRPDASDPRWEGNDPKTGELYSVHCPDALKIKNRQELINFVGYLFVPTGSAPAQLPASPEVLAHRALAKLQLPTPKVGIGPNVDRVVVKSWTWLWVDEADPIEVTETDGPVTVTLRAELTSVTWDMGEPVNIKFPWGEKGSVTCDGPGIPPGEDYVMNVEPGYPACAYKYIYRSDEERTNGVGRWPVTATTTWRVTWSSNTGASGGFQDADMQGAGSALVGEIRTILVAGEGNGGG